MGTACKYKTKAVTRQGRGFGRLSEASTDYANGRMLKGCVACERQGDMPHEAAACQVHA